MTVVASNYAREENDLYQTEPWAVDALARVLSLEMICGVWEPAAGHHMMVDALKKYTDPVWTSDVTTYDRKHSEIFDFLSDDEPQIIPSCDVEAIITNPPYGKANRDAVKFAVKALERCDGWVALLLTAKFDFGKTRQHLFKNNPRFYGKIALLDRISWEGNGKTGTEDHAWYIWGPVRQTYTPEIFYEGKVPALEAAA